MLADEEARVKISLVVTTIGRKVEDRKLTSGYFSKDG